jgi:hypothetical protein
VHFGVYGTFCLDRDSHRVNCRLPRCFLQRGSRQFAVAL